MCGLCIGAACGAALHKPVVIASCEQRAGHTREQLPCPVCDWAVSMGDNVSGVYAVKNGHTSKFAMKHGFFVFKAEGLEIIFI